MNKIRATSIVNVSEINFFQESLHNAKDGDAPTKIFLRIFSDFSEHPFECFW